jgi:amino acid adenylation domain-containing protein
MKNNNNALTESMPLTLPQLEIWMAQAIYADLPIYNLAAYLPIQAKIDPERFEQAVISLVQLHDALRIMLTQPKTDDGLPRQHIKPSFPVPFQVWDFSKKTNPHHFAQDWMNQRCDEPFTLYASPLFRFDLIKISDNCWYFFNRYHHIIMDGESHPLIYQALAKLYAQSCAEPSGQGVYSYTAYIENDLAYRTSERYARDTAYWQEQSVTPSELLLQPRHSLQTKAPLANAREVLVLTRERYQALQALAERLDATFLSLLASVLCVYFNRTSQKNALTIALAVHNRSYTKFKKTAGLFAKVLPLWFDFNGELNFDELVKKAHRRIKEHLRHHRYPATQRINKQNRAPFSAGFDVSLSYMIVDREINFSGNQTRPIPIQQDYRLTPLGIQIYVPPAAGNIELECNYNQAYFSEQDIRLLVRRLDILLQSVIAEPSSKINDLPLWDDEERKQVLQTWNATARPYPKNYCIHQMFEEQVMRTPDTIALVFGDQQLSYGELDIRANQLANWLIGLGVVPETLVGVCLERSPDLVVALLGILKAGGAYVPLDPSYPEARLAFMLEDAQMPVLVTQQVLRGHLPAFAGRTVCLDSDGPAIAAQPKQAPAAPAIADHLAYVIYTSGSTGVPKGVLINHRSLLNLIYWHRQAYEVTAADRATQIAGQGFDALVWELWPYLTAGAGLHIVNEAARLEPKRLVQWLVDNQITLAFLPTPLAEAVLLEHWPEASQLRILLTGGDKLNRWPLATLPFRVVNHYGPTENTVVTTSVEVSGQASSDKAPPIGRPITNTQVYLLDGRGEPVPIGAVGEIYIGGVQVARGYLNRPELTAKKFVPDPFGGGEDGRLYRSGDLGRWLPEGVIEFMGRNDDQVKVRGFRIELGEIEAALGLHPAVRAGVVLAREDAAGDKRLVAYLAAPGAADGLEAELRAQLRTQLPEHMMPSAFVVLERLPLTPNGKIDRKALPVPDRSGLEASYVAPRTPAEAVVADVWAEVLGIERVGAEDNFFELGGHSLLAVKALEILRERTGVDLPTRIIFEMPAPAQLAKCLTNGHLVIDTGEQAEPNAVPGRIMSIFEILNKQQYYLKTWQGKRLTPGSFIVTLNELGTRHGLFWCLQAYHELTQLAKHLGSDQPVHGMRSGHEIMDYTEENVFTIASYYAEEMVALQPDGSFLIGGNCQAGIIAHAIALRLRTLGRRVSLLILMEQDVFFPYTGSVMLIFGRDSTYYPYKPGSDPDAVFRNSYPEGYTVDIIEGTHGQFFESPNIETLAEAINRRLSEVGCV